VSRFREFLYLDGSTVGRLLTSAAVETAQAAQIAAANPNAEQQFRQLWEAVQSEEDQIVAEGQAGSDVAWEDVAEGAFCNITGQLSVPSIVASISCAGDAQLS